MSDEDKQLIRKINRLVNSSFNEHDTSSVLFCVMLNLVEKMQKLARLYKNKRLYKETAQYARIAKLALASLDHFFEEEFFEIKDLDEIERLVHKLRLSILIEDHSTFE
jgi:hypothetical protein